MIDDPSWFDDDAPKVLRSGTSLRDPGALARGRARKLDPRFISTRRRPRAVRSGARLSRRPAVSPASSVPPSGRASLAWLVACALAALLVAAIAVLVNAAQRGG